MQQSQVSSKSCVSIHSHIQHVKCLLDVAEDCTRLVRQNNLPLSLPTNRYQQIFQGWCLPSQIVFLNSMFRKIDSVTSFPWHHILLRKSKTAEQNVPQQTAWNVDFEMRVSQLMKWSTTREVFYESPFSLGSKKQMSGLILEPTQSEDLFFFPTEAALVFLN